MTGRRCNPYGYATDAGPKHLMGGMFGPEYAGHQNLVLESGTKGLGICQNPATVRAYLECEAGHRGPVMDLCLRHVTEIRQRMSQTCTRCVWPEQARGLNESIERTMRQVSEAAWRGDLALAGRLRARIADLGREMDELRDRGVIATRPLVMHEIS